MATFDAAKNRDSVERMGMCDQAPSHGKTRCLGGEVFCVIAACSLSISSLLVSLNA